jgi:hypothetical protein
MKISRGDELKVAALASLQPTLQVAEKEVAGCPSLCIRLNSDRSRELRFDGRRGQDRLASASFPRTKLFPTFLSRAARITECEDLDPSGREASGQLKLATHSLDDVSERTQVHVGSPFNLGNGALVDSKFLRQLHLRKVLRLSQLCQR